MLGVWGASYLRELSLRASHKFVMALIYRCQVEVHVLCLYLRLLDLLRHLLGGFGRPLFGCMTALPMCLLSGILAPPLLPDDFPEILQLPLELLPFQVHLSHLDAHLEQLLVPPLHVLIDLLDGLLELLHLPRDLLRPLVLPLAVLINAGQLLGQGVSLELELRYLHLNVQFLALINISVLLHIPVEPLTLLALLLQHGLHAGDRELVPLDRLHAGIKHTPNVVFAITYQADRALIKGVCLG